MEQQILEMKAEVARNRSELSFLKMQVKINEIIQMIADLEVKLNKKFI